MFASVCSGGEAPKLQSFWLLRTGCYLPLAMMCETGIKISKPTIATTTTITTTFGSSKLWLPTTSAAAMLLGWHKCSNWTLVVFRGVRLVFPYSRLPADRVLFQIGVHGAAYSRIEVCGAEVFE